MYAAQLFGLLAVFKYMYSVSWLMQTVNSDTKSCTWSQLSPLAVDLPFQIVSPNPNCYFLFVQGKTTSNWSLKTA